MVAKPMDKQTLAAKREQYRNALEDAVRRIVAALARRPEVERAILFGSYARGRRDLFTDLDVLIVMDSTLDFVSRTAEMYRDLCCPVDLDLLVYTPEELARNRDRGFIRRALEEGKVIYEKRAA
jgi:predicted nucleotidyltransferase